MKKELMEYSEEQIGRIIGIFNVKVLRDFLQHNSKRYQKYYIGFRAEALKINQLQDKFVHLILITCDKMVIKFVCAYIDQWLGEIDAEIMKRGLNSNATKNEVIADVLLDSVFSNDFILYFDLENNDSSETEIMDIITHSVLLKKIREVEKKYKTEIDIIKLEDEEKMRSNLSKVHDECEEICHKKQCQIDKYIDDIEQIKKDNQIAVDKFNTSEEMIKTLKKDLTENKIRVETLISEIREKDSLLSTYFVNLNEKNGLIEKYSIELESLADTIKKNEASEEKIVLGCDFANVNKLEKITDASELMSDHFKEELDENFYNIGCQSLDSLYLSELICHAIANNLPVFSNMFLADVLTKCISATIDGGAYVKMIVTDEMKFNACFIDFIKNVPERVIQIDCFLGKYDESNFLNLIRECSHLKKVFILSLTYDKQIKYIPVEVLNYMEYISLASDLINKKEENLRYFNIDNLEIVGEDSKIYQNKFSKLVEMIKIDKNYISVREKGTLNDKTILAYFALQLIPFLTINRELGVNELINSIEDDNIAVELRKVLTNG